MNKKYYLGLDIGTDSVGYAVTDENYRLLRFHGDDAWGVTIFDQAALSGERRSFRSARRRLDRRQQRVQFVQELFAEEIAKIDDRFFIRLKESMLFREDVQDDFTLFNDDVYTDKQYYSKYPTIHHLIVELMNSNEPHDVRLVYLAIAWLVSHRGHFLSNIDKEHLEKIKDFDGIYSNFMGFFTQNGYASPWEDIDIAEFGKALCIKTNVTNKNKKLIEILFNGRKPEKKATEDFGYSREAIVKLLSGGKVTAAALFCNDEFEEAGSFSLGMEEEKYAELEATLGDEFELISMMRTLYDWALLIDVLGDYKTISEAKVKVYDVHKSDLTLLKYIIRKYIPEKYNEVFRTTGKANYVAYTGHGIIDSSESNKKCDIEAFSTYVSSIIKNIVPEEKDMKDFEEMKERLSQRSFLPKQKNTDNRVIPHQLYWYELKKILEKASAYLGFLISTDKEGLSVAEKIESIFLFRVPYFVGPLNPHSSYSWIVRKPEKIYPWNIESIVDFDASEQAFIQKLTNTCTYLPGEYVLPKDSLCYHMYSVLNELNNLRINGVRISVEIKQQIYNDLFMNTKKVTRKRLTSYLISNGIIEKGEEDNISGIDIEIKSNLMPQIAFKKLIEKGLLTEDDAERIIERSTYAEDKSRLSRWLDHEYPDLPESEKKYITNLKFKDFGRLSRRFLVGIEGVNKETGEIMTILNALWTTQNNLMELLSDRFTFREEIEAYRSDYYEENKLTLEKRLDNMYLSNAVRRPVYRTLAVVKDIVKAFGTPEKIFVEMARGATDEQRGKRTKTRKQQILDLYARCKDEDIHILREQLEQMGEAADSKLQGDKLFLYYMQLGKCMYSGEPITLENLGSKLYDIDHIYPQAYVKDDSIINNKVLVLSTKNGEKGDQYPIKEDIRIKMRGYWDFLRHIGLIGDEKYKRLTRNTPFTDEEKYGFINRQLTETTQSTKAVTEILKEKYPTSEIVYVKARLTSDFRREFDILKSRIFNDLHHAVDAYLNIVTGNVYNMKFSKRWFDIHSRYSIKTTTLFSYPVICGGNTVWNGKEMLSMVKNTAHKNTAHFTKYAFFKTGGLFDQMPVKASDYLVPLKKDLPTSKLVMLI